MKFSTLLLICFAVILVSVYARGRGGGSRGGFRGSSSRSRSSSRYTGSGRRYSSTRYSGYIAAAAAGATVYGLTRYNRRFRGTSYYRDDPPLCSNFEKYVTFENGTISTTQKMELFVCPFEEKDDPSATYCCGPEYQEHCCTYWESPGRTAGAVIGFIILGVLVVVIIVCACKMCKGRSSRRKEGAVVYRPSDGDSSKPAAPTLINNSGAAPAYPGYPTAQPPYPSAPAMYPPSTAPAPAAPGGIGFEGVAPPSYEQAAVKPF